MGVIEKFMPVVMEREDDGHSAPIIQVVLSTKEIDYILFYIHLFLDH